MAAVRSVTSRADALVASDTHVAVDGRGRFHHRGTNSSLLSRRFHQQAHLEKNGDNRTSFGITTVDDAAGEPFWRSDLKGKPSLQTAVSNQQDVGLSGGSGRPVVAGRGGD